MGLCIYRDVENVKSQFTNTGHRHLDTRLWPQDQWIFTLKENQGKSILISLSEVSTCTVSLTWKRFLCTAINLWPVKIVFSSFCCSKLRGVLSSEASSEVSEVACEMDRLGTAPWHDSGSVYRFGMKRNCFLMFWQATRRGLSQRAQLIYLYRFTVTENIIVLLTVSWLRGVGWV